MSDFTARRSAFRMLHDSGCFILPNPWDIGSARYLRHLGFRALATTSSGFAFSRGLPDGDGAVARDAVLGHITEIVAAVELPVNADFEAGYADQPEAVAGNVRLCVATGVAGLSIEDSTTDGSKPLYDFGLAVERIRAARAAIDAAGAGVMLTGRCEAYLVGHPEPLRESIRRLQAYADAGADVLYAPGARERADIGAIVSAVAPRPVNVLLSPQSGLTMSDLAALGVRRISVGSWLARAAWTGFLGAAKALAEHGSCSGLDAVVPFDQLNQFFRQDLRARAPRAGGGGPGAE